MNFKSSYQKVRRSLHDGSGLVGAAKYSLDEAFNTPAYQRRQNEALLRWHELESRLKEDERQAAQRLTETIERYGGRVALVTNFGNTPGMSGLRQVGLNIAQALVERGFDGADRLVVNSLLSMSKVDRVMEFHRSRVFVRDGFKSLMPRLGHISSNESFHTDQWNLPPGVLGQSLEFSADFRDEREPEANLGYVCIVSALELNSFGQAIEFSLLGASGEDYDRIKFGGALMFNGASNQWEQVVPGDQFSRLPKDLQLKSYNEPQAVVI